MWQIGGNKLESSQYLEIFIDESVEHLDTLYEQLMELEKSPDEIQIIEEIFRAAHTLKGMAATMGYDELAGLTHTMENIFDAIREEKLTVETEMMDVLFHAVDTLNAIVEDIASGGDGKRDVKEISAQLEQIEKGEVLTTSTSTENEKSTEQKDEQFHLELDEFQITILEESKEQDYNHYNIIVELSEDCLLKGARAYMVFELLEKHGEIIHSEPSVHDLEEENFDYSFALLFVSKEHADDIKGKVMKVSEVRDVIVEPFSLEQYKHEQEEALHAKEIEEKETKATTASQQKKSTKEQQTPSASVSTPTKTIRVNIERLDILMNLFEELVIDRGRLEQISSELNNSELQDTVERMSRVSSDLQNIILTMRMVPIDTVFNRFPRMIRQLARDLHKEVEVEIVGADTELDRTVIDEIGDPLVHLIRNAMDHGIETHEERETLGKPHKVKITLEAYHSANHVFV